MVNSKPKAFASMIELVRVLSSASAGAGPSLPLQSAPWAAGALHMFKKRPKTRPRPPLRTRTVKRRRPSDYCSITVDTEWLIPINNNIPTILNYSNLSSLFNCGIPTMMCKYVLNYYCDCLVIVNCGGDVIFIIYKPLVRMDLLFTTCVFTKPIPVGN